MKSIMPLIGKLPMTGVLSAGATSVYGNIIEIMNIGNSNTAAKRSARRVLTTELMRVLLDGVANCSLSCSAASKPMSVTAAMTLASASCRGMFASVCTVADSVSSETFTAVTNGRDLIADSMEPEHVAHVIPPMLSAMVDPAIAARGECGLVSSIVSDSKPMSAMASCTGFRSVPE